MSKARRWFVGLVVAGAASWALWGAGDSEVNKPDDAVNRVWLERLPKTPRDVVGHFVLVQDGGSRIGVVGRSSTWKHDIELFKWALEKDQLMQAFPQTNKVAKTRIDAKECDAPKPFELCLEMDGKRQYYSRHDWVIEPGQTAAEVLADHPEIAALVQIPAAVDEDQ